MNEILIDKLGLKDADEADRQKVIGWFLSRPIAVREAILKYPPHKTYRLKSTNQIVRIYSYSEDDDGKCKECRITVLPKDNPTVLIPRVVFGIKFKDLEMIKEAT